MFDHFVELALREMNKLGVYVYVFFILIWRIVALSIQISLIKAKKDLKDKNFGKFQLLQIKKIGYFENCSFFTFWFFKIS